MPTMYKIVTSVPKGKLTHILLKSVDSIFLEELEIKIQLKIGQDLQDENNNHFKVNGYFGEYIILRSDRLGTHPVGMYLTGK